MKLLQPLLIALSMYSKLPVPGIAWTEANMKYAMCFFPVVGGITGLFGWLLGSFLLPRSSSLFFAVCMTLLPLAVSGGIHMDGFMDTMDALNSYGDREKRLKIMEDPHTGAFAVLGCGCFLLLQAGLFSELTKEMLPVVCWGYVLSRAASGLAVVTFPAAKEGGLLKTFRDRAGRRRTAAVLAVWILLAAAFMLSLSLPMGLAALCLAALTFLHYYCFAKRQFGGITGDLAGYFLQVCELAVLAGTVIAGGFLWNSC